MQKVLATIIFITLTGTAAAQEVAPEVEEGISSIKQTTFDFNVETRFFTDKGADEFIFKHKNISADWIHAGDNLFKVKADREIFSLMGTGLEWNVALNTVDKKFAVLPSVGINFYMRIRPRLDIYFQFSGMTLGKRGHFCDFETGLKYFPQKNFSISAGWRRVDFKLRRGGEVSDFDLNGMFAGVRYDF